MEMVLHDLTAHVQVEKKVGVFLEDSTVKRLKFPPTEKLGRLIM